MRSETPEITQFLALDDVHIEYCYLRGARDGFPTFVLLHEGLGSASQWRDFPEQLRDRTGCSVVVYSRQGYGKSSSVELPRPLDFLSQHGVQELGRVIDTLSLSSVVLLGHSDGGSIALAYAAINDPRVLGTIALAPHVLVEKRTLEGIRASTLHWQRGTFRDRLIQHHGANVDGAFYGWSNSWLHPQFTLAKITCCLANIKTPLLVLQGREDQYAPLEQLNVIQQLVVASCQCVALDHCQHFPHREATEQTLHLISNFITDMSA
ncbi:alpha/beta fold hydrolase [Pseudomonas sp. AM8]|uniref:alpha/beta fold hydrolase n=1 Tax=Pseudomonas sp. AM8 TaxID=2983368 RepID=UPI002E7FCE00|nr:alpha/beta hydrolase [Pseudomonas sp. AM8]